jgi:hypothetical protein
MHVLYVKLLLLSDVFLLFFRSFKHRVFATILNSFFVLHFSSFLRALRDFAAVLAFPRAVCSQKTLSSLLMIVLISVQDIGKIFYFFPIKPLHKMRSFISFFSVIYIQVNLLQRQNFPFWFFVLWAKKMSQTLFW